MPIAIPLTIKGFIRIESELLLDLGGFEFSWRRNRKGERERRRDRKEGLSSSNLYENYRECDRLLKDFSRFDPIFAIIFDWPRKTDLLLHCK